MLNRLVCVCLLGALLLPLPDRAVARARAATLHVDALTGNDANTCLSVAAACQTIGGALAKAAAGDTISIAPGTYAEGGLQPAGAVTLAGAGRDTTIIDGGATARILSATAALTVTGLTLRNGRAKTITLPSDNVHGGAIYASGPLVLRDSTLRDNRADGSGGALATLGDTRIERTLFISNTAARFGGALYAAGGSTVISSSQWLTNSAGDSGGALISDAVLTMTAALLRANTSAGNGGAVFASSGSLLLERAALVANRGARGGALSAAGAAVEAVNVTFSGNVASAPGSADGGGALLVASPTTLRHATVVSNSTLASGAAPGGILLQTGGTLLLSHSVIAGNNSRQCRITGGAGISSLGHNLASDSNCALTGTGDLPATPAGVGPLIELGGLPAHAPLPGSRAIDAGGAGCATADQRQQPRPLDGDGIGGAQCDAGAIETRLQAFAAPASALEGNSSTPIMVFTVTVSPTPTQSVSVTYGTVPINATPGADFRMISGTLDFAAGQASRTISVEVLGDVSDEADETFAVLLTPTASVDVYGGPVIGTIIDNDGGGSVSITDAEVIERDGGLRTMDFALTMSPVQTTPVTVTVATADGSASAGSDYAGLAGTLVFTPGTTRLTVTVVISGDVIDEGDAETFQVQLLSVQGGFATRNAGTGRIIDDDASQFRISASPPVSEGNAGLSLIPITVTLTSAQAATATLQYATSANGSAKPGTDFQPVSGTLAFTPGVTMMLFFVPVIGDTLGEPDESVSIGFSNASLPVNVTGTSITIRNDDRYRAFVPVVSQSP